MPQPNSGPVNHVVIMVQENHTTDNYFLSMAAYGANIATGWPISPNPPVVDPPHDRHAYYRFLTQQSTGERVQFDNSTVLPFYAWLAASGAFLENHCAGFGTNSTPNHLLIVGGQSPTLRNPRHNTSPVWDMPSLPGHAEDNGVTWKGYTGSTGYPLEFYQQLKGSANIVTSKSPQQFRNDAANGDLPALSMIWHDSPADEHPLADVSIGMNEIWQSVDAVVQAGLWDQTVFLLTWDDWGGYDDHVATPNVEYTPDGVQLAYGPRVPLLMFGGRVRPGIDHRWCSHVSLPKTALQLLNLPPLGVSRLDADGGLADLVELTGNGGVMPKPPAYGSTIVLPAPPADPTPTPPPPSPVVHTKLVDEVILRDGTSLGRPQDVLITRP